MKHIDIENEVHSQLTIYKAQKNAKTLSEAVQKLLDEAASNAPI